MLEYLNILFLIEARSLAKTLSGVAARQPALRDAFVAVGELDALQAAASFRAGLPWFSTPTIALGEVMLAVSDLVHPLVENPVPNSILLRGKGALVTGSNMSGKSTFLRALGVNATLAQSRYTCTARRYTASELRSWPPCAPPTTCPAGKASISPKPSAFWPSSGRWKGTIPPSA